MVKFVEEGPAAIPPGTKVRVENLFGKIPARRKFLRTARSEYAACTDVVRRLAMARPDIGFTLDHEGRKAISVQGGETGPDRVAALTSRDLRANSVAVDLVREEVKLSGVAGLPTYNRGVADHQFLFRKWQTGQGSLADRGSARCLCRNAGTGSAS